MVDWVADVVDRVANQLPTAADELLSSLGFGEGKHGGAVDVVGQTCEVVGEAGEVVGTGPPAHSLSVFRTKTN